MLNPGIFPATKRHGTYLTGGWMDLESGVEGFGKSRHPELPAPDPADSTESLYRLGYHNPWEDKFVKLTNIFYK